MWIIFTLASAFFDSLRALFGKKQADKLDFATIALGQWLFALIILIPLLFLQRSSIPATNFWFILFISGLLNTIATLLFWKALILSDISLVIPIAALSPIFLFITSPLIIHEFPSPIGILGIILTVIGTYFLSLSERIHGIWQPFLSLWKYTGSRLALLVAIIYSITSNLDKVAINYSSPVVYLTFLHIIVALMIFFGLKQQKIGINRKQFLKVIPVGIVFGISLLLQMFALTLTIVPYVITLKRTNTLFGILWGKIYFHEKQIKERILGAIVMFIGIGVIIFFGK